MAQTSYRYKSLGNFSKKLFIVVFLVTSLRFDLVSLGLS